MKKFIVVFKQLWSLYRIGAMRFGLLHPTLALQKAGFGRSNNPNNISNLHYRHPDGSEVRIHQHGNQNPSGYESGNNAHVHKQDPQGNQLSDAGKPTTNPNDSHIGIRNPSDLPSVRGRPHGDGN